jgi:regulator of sigma D
MKSEKEIYQQLERLQDAAGEDLEDFQTSLIDMVFHNHFESFQEMTNEIYVAQIARRTLLWCLDQDAGPWKIEESS